MLAPTITWLATCTVSLSCSIYQVYHLVEHTLYFRFFWIWWVTGSLSIIITKGQRSHPPFHWWSWSSAWMDSRQRRMSPTLLVLTLFALFPQPTPWELMKIPTPRGGMRTMSATADRTKASTATSPECSTWRLARPHLMTVQMELPSPFHILTTSIRSEKLINLHKSTHFHGNPIIVHVLFCSRVTTSWSNLTFDLKHWIFNV